MVIMNFRKDRKFSATDRGFNRPSRDDRAPVEDKKFKQPKPLIQTTTLWDFPSQHYGQNEQGDGEYAGVTPSYVIWNLLQRYTKPGATVLDPMCGSGTTLDVCKDLGRKGLGFDLAPSRSDVKKSDARKLPIEKGVVDFVFMDPPYSTHIKYSGDAACIGELDARGGGYFEAMEQVIAELYRVTKDGGYLALYIQDSFSKGKPFAPLGFELFLRLSALFDPVDIVCVTRHNKKLKRNHWHTSAIEGNFYLRGFNYLFVFRKNAKLDQAKLKHEESGALSYYFQQVAKSRPGEVVTPDTLAKALESDREELDKKLIRKEGKKNFKEVRRTEGGPHRGAPSGNKGGKFQPRPKNKDHLK
jgi:DNA modification methylase